MHSGSVIVTGIYKRVVLSLAFLVLSVFAKPFLFAESYLLTSPPYNPGFFSVFHTVLGCLDEYEKNNWDALRVDFGEEGLYYDEKIGPNWWEYFFEPISLQRDSSVTPESFEKFPTYEKIAFSLTSQFELPRIRTHELIEKYVKLKPHIQEKISNFCTTFFKENFILGVHYRGTDKVAEAPELTYDAVSRNIQSTLDHIEYEDVKVFIATDDENFLNFIKGKFPGKIIASNAMRSLDGNPVHQFETQKNYLKGEGAILDCMLLSNCHLLIKMASNLSDVSVEFNPNLPFIQLNKSYFE